MSVIITHAWMEEAVYGDHVALREQDAFARIVASALGHDARVISSRPSRVARDVAAAGGDFDLFVFWSGTVNEDVLAACKQAKKLTVFVSDPNWPTVVDPGRDDFVLATQFQSLDDDTDYKSRLAKYDIDVTLSERHVFLPLGEMPLIDRQYARVFTMSPAIGRAILPSHERAEAAYAGSLKPSRAHIMAQEAAEGSCDVYGNFTSSQLAEYWTNRGKGSLVNLSLHTRGKVAPNQVWRVYQEHGTALMISDPAMVDLSTHYLRPFEYALSGARIRVASDSPELQAFDDKYIHDLVCDDNGVGSVDVLRANYDMDLRTRVIDSGMFS